METVGIYISVPFCRSKCSFCNFASGVFPAARFDRYVARVIEDIRRVRGRMDVVGAVVPGVVDSIYLGGGTPSILPPSLLQALFASVRDEFQVSPDAEITVECAPGQVTDEMLAAMVEAGVNRVSFGVQSFVDREAAVTGRLHDRAVALADIERVRRAGIARINVDLIAGLPLQTAQSWLESMGVLAGTGVSHASIYMFEVDEGSRLGGEVLAGGARYSARDVPSDDSMADFYSEAVEFLSGVGLPQYEISNFAAPGDESRHNSKYWLRQPYLGFGLDAHSMLSGPEVRFAAEADLDDYIHSTGVKDLRWLSPRDSLEETWFLGLRRNEGIDLGQVRLQFGEAGCFDDVVGDLVDEGLLEIRDNRVRLTARGRLLSNEVFERFITSETELVLVD